jgi:hypothetical protein
MTGSSPLDRGKAGSKIHVLSERGGVPLTVAVSAANTNDSYALKPLVTAIQRSSPDAAHTTQTGQAARRQGLRPA